MADPEKPQSPTDVPDEAPEGPGTVGFMAEFVRKAVLTGVGALFLTEEGARKVAREWKLPKDLATYLVSQAAGARDEVLRVVGHEIRRLLDNETFRREILKSIENMTVEVHAEMRLKASEDGPVPPVKVRVKQRRHKEQTEDGEE
ncbi:MAG: hypothetical protein WCK73_12515 [Deltaproteobacteria bacterium]